MNLGELLLDNYTWQRDAECVELSPAEADKLFFPEKGAPSKKAIAMCNRCLVKDECREFALKHSAGYGIWAGEPASTLQERAGLTQDGNPRGDFDPVINRRALKLTAQDVWEIRCKFRDGASIAALAREYELNETSTRHCIYRGWREVPHPTEDGKPPALKGRNNRWTEDNVRDIRARYDSGQKPAQIAMAYDAPVNDIGKIARRERYKSVPDVAAAA